MFTPTTARRTVALLAAPVAAFALGACAGDAGADASGGPVWQAPESGAATARPPARVKAVTSACDLLSANVMVKILGSAKGTELTATESPDAGGNGKPYTCVYGNGSQEVLSLVATTLPDRADTVRETVDAVAEDSGGETTRIDSVGADAVSYVEDDVRVLAFVEPYEKDLRMAVLSGPALIPQDKYVDLAKKVAERL